MCGIVGFTGAPQPEALTCALAAIAHRGPDDEGRYEDCFLSIGHRRLSIIDLAGGHQPMHTDDGRYVLAFNGEIYNFRELRLELEQNGHRFRTSSDTEVLLQWLACRGTDGLANLNGMFALALWDRREKRLLLARDRFGIKPLYVCQYRERLVFSSEIKAILAIGVPAEPDLQTLFQFLTFQNVLTDQTFFRSIAKLGPGSWLAWSRCGITSGRFWTVKFQYRDIPFDDLVGAYRQALDRAVARHMIADVPVGSYLSGGIDSSSVTIVAARMANAKMHTFTGAFLDTPYYDERVGSRAVAAQAGAELHEVEIQPDDFCDAFGRVIFHLDEPTLGTGALPQFVVARLAAKHVKVVLTGHGGDEAFAGYQVSKAILVRELLKRKPLAAMRQLARVTSDELSRVLYFSIYPMIHSEVAYGLFIMTPRRRRERRLTPAFLSAMNGYEPLDEIRGLVDKGMSAAERLQTLYLKTYLPTLFIQEDKMGMAHSLESRMPLCDNELIDLALSINFEKKLEGGVLKAIPKRAMHGELPEVLYTLPKRGFPTPFARWFRQGRVREMLEDLLLSRRAAQRGVFEPSYVARLVAANTRSHSDTLMDYARANELYSIAAIEQWFRTFVDQGRPAPVQ